mgnify:CR=1 FL=1
MLQYKKRRVYKYTLAAPYSFATGIQLERSVSNRFITLRADGQLELASAYAWDGASGPMPDLPSIMRASLIHDALYQLIREQKLASSHRLACDQLLRQACLADGMSPALAQWVYFCVRRFGARYTRPDLIQLDLSPAKPITDIAQTSE